MLEIIQGLRSIQQQIDHLVAQLQLLAPESGDRLAETCRSLANTPFCLSEPVLVKPYQVLIPGLWLGFAKTVEVQVRQHLRADTGNEDGSYALTISTAPGFQSSWLTIEFILGRSEIVTKTALSMNVQLSSSVSGELQFAVKAHGREIEPRFTELVKYDVEEGMLQITDIASMGRSVIGITEEFHDIRVLIFLPPVANATFTFSHLKLALL